MGFLARQPKVAYKTARASFAWDTLEKNHPATSAARHFIFTLTLDLMPKCSYVVLDSRRSFNDLAAKLSDNE